MRLEVITQNAQLPRTPPGVKLPDIVPTLRYRPELFGGPYGAVLQDSTRGASRWSVGERELFAAFVSSRNHCRF